MKRVLKILGATVLVLLLAAGAFYGWATVTTQGILEQTFTAHEATFPVPFPLTEAELEGLRHARQRELQANGVDLTGVVTADGSPPDLLADVDVNALALEQAIERGRHLVTARYACAECHGNDLSGGVMVDDPAMGQLLGPNITSGGRTRDYTVTDWDHIVRHGILPGGRPAAMPSEDFVRMSDRELSDIIAYVRAQPPVDNVVPGVRLGPVGTILVATGKLPLSASNIQDHQRAHEVEPPSSEPTAEFGQHLVAVCTGCHRADLSGGPIAAGPPDWLPAANLTPHADGLAGWDYDDFAAAMRRGVRPDGSALRAPMTNMRRYAEAMTEVEMQALWAYISTVPAQPRGR